MTRKPAKIYTDELSFKIRMSTTRHLLEAIKESLHSAGPVDLSEVLSQALTQRFGAPVDIQAKMTLDPLVALTEITLGHTSQRPEPACGDAESTDTDQYLTGEHVCPAVHFSETLISHLEVREIPPDWDRPPPYTKAYNFNAILRHQFTNYDYLLKEHYEEVPWPDPSRPIGGSGLQVPCLWYLAAGGTCTADGHCDTRDITIYNDLRWAATEKAEQAYKRWLIRYSS